MGVYRVGVQGKRADSIVVAPSLAEAAVRYSGWYPDAQIKHVIEGAGLADVLNAMYPQDWQRQLNALLRAVWEEHNDELEARLVRHAIAEEIGDNVCEIIEAKEAE